VDILLIAWNRFRRKHPKGNVGHELFRRDLAKYHNVAFYGQQYLCNFRFDITLQQLFDKYGKPDFIFTHAEHRAGTSPTGIFDELGKTDILKVHYSGDYWKRSWNSYDEHFRTVHYDIIFVPDSQILRDMEKRGMNDGQKLLLPLSVDTSVFYDRHLPKTLDVASPIGVPNQYRKQLKDLIDSLDVRTATDRVFFDDYIKRLNESKIIVTNNSRSHHLSFKYTETLACGTLIMGDKPTDLDITGFRDGEHLILYDTFDDMERKIEYFLKHDDEREAIAKNGMEFVRKYHSNRVRVAEFTEMIRTRKQIDWNERINKGYTPMFQVRL